MDIIKGTYRDYVFLFGECRNAYSDREAKISSKGNKLYFIKDSMLPVGYICLSENADKSALIVGYVCVVEEKRHQGFGKRLIKWAVDLFHASDYSYLSLSITEKSKGFQEVCKICHDFSFREGKGSTVFHSTQDQEDFDSWYDYMENKGRLMCEVLEKRGFKAFPFSSLTDEQIKKIYNSNKNEYGNPLQVNDNILDANGNVDFDLSHAAYKDGELASYVLLTKMSSKAVIFQHISVAEKYRGSGCIFLPFSYSMNVFRDKGYRQLSYMMFDDNVHANAFRKKLLGRLTGTSQRCINFILRRM